MVTAQWSTTSLPFLMRRHLGGNVIAAVLNQEYQIASVPTVNTFTIEAKDTSGATVTANASDSGNGGGSTVATYQINTGLNAFVQGTGWGAGTWGAGTWGSSSSTLAAGQLRLFSQDSFGEDLIFNIRGGGIYYWDESAGTSTRAINATALSGASNVPTVALQVLVSDIDQHVIAFGSNPIGSSNIDPLFIRFSDQENAADWTPTATNTAGGVRINSGSEIIGAVQTRQEILVFTDVSLHSMRFVGAPFTFQFATLSTDISMISPNAAVNARGRCTSWILAGSMSTTGQCSHCHVASKSMCFLTLTKGKRSRCLLLRTTTFQRSYGFTQ
jgi:hypothetical protein